MNARIGLVVAIVLAPVLWLGVSRGCNDRRGTRQVPLLTDKQKLVFPSDWSQGAAYVIDKNRVLYISDQPDGRSLTINHRDSGRQIHFDVLELGERDQLSDVLQNPSGTKILFSIYDIPINQTFQLLDLTSGKISDLTKYIEGYKAVRWEPNGVVLSQEDGWKTHYLTWNPDLPGKPPAPFATSDSKLLRIWFLGDGRQLAADGYGISFRESDKQAWKVISLERSIDPDQTLVPAPSLDVSAERKELLFTVYDVELLKPGEGELRKVRYTVRVGLCSLDNFETREIARLELKKYGLVLVRWLDKNSVLLTTDQGTYLFDV